MADREPDLGGIHDDDVVTLVCMPVADSLIEGDRKVSCSECGTECWVSAKSDYLIIVYGERMLMLCVQCALVKSITEDAEWRMF